uniref:Uncharacterized protein n=1 Tax=Rhipicephalus zambeziensis TaxID=60191 RepID=A0A224Y777_9ACAR
MTNNIRGTCACRCDRRPLRLCRSTRVPHAAVATEHVTKNGVEPSYVEHTALAVLVKEHVGWRHGCRLLRHHAGFTVANTGTEGFVLERGLWAARRVEARVVVGAAPHAAVVGVACTVVKPPGQRHLLANRRADCGHAHARSFGADRLRVSVVLVPEGQRVSGPDVFLGVKHQPFSVEALVAATGRPGRPLAHGG